jgi:hypothetical protein
MGNIITSRLKKTFDFKINLEFEISRKRELVCIKVGNVQKVYYNSVPVS